MRSKDKDEKTVKDADRDEPEKELETEGDDESEDAEDGESEADVAGESGVSKKMFFIDRSYDGLLPVSLLAALIGALLGLIPATLLAYLTGIVFYPFFVAAPLLAFLFNKLLKGGRDLRALISVAVFSLACSYVTALACQAAIYISAHNLPIFQIFLLTGLELGKSGVLPASASAYIYPLVFTVFGVALVWELLRGVKPRDAEQPEPAEEDSDEDELPDADEVENDEDEQPEPAEDE